MDSQEPETLPALGAEARPVAANRAGHPRRGPSYLRPKQAGRGPRPPFGRGVRSSTAFVDTSTLYTVPDHGEVNHTAARQTGEDRWRDGTSFPTTNCVLVETSSLIQSRLGRAALRKCPKEFVPFLLVERITQRQHRAAMESPIMASRRHLSLAGGTSFPVMRENDVREAFCFDRHFRGPGFRSKQPDMFWTVRGAHAILALGCCQLDGR